VVYKVPDEQLVLRYATAIDEKHKKYLKYISDGFIAQNDSYIIAINGSSLSYSWADAEIPRFLKAVSPIGALQVVLHEHSRLFQLRYLTTANMAG
jgi:type I restriction enzyme S subunit